MFDKVNVLSWFLVVYAINTIIGGVYFWMSSPHFGVYNSISWVDFAVVNVISVVVFVPFLLSRRFFEIKNYYATSNGEWRKNSGFYIVLLIVGFYLAFTYGQPLWNMNYLEMAEARVIGDEQVGSWGLSFQLFHGLAMFTYIKLIVARFRSNERLLTFFVICYAIMILSVGTIALHKQDLILPILLPVVISVTLNYGRGIKLKPISVIISISFLMFIYYISTGRSSIYFLSGELANRIVIGQVGPLFLWYDYFSTYDFLWGASLPNPGGLLPYDSVNVAAQLMEYYFAVKGSIPVAFWGYAFADFGILGVLAIPYILLVYLLLLVKVAKRSLIKLDLVALGLYIALKLMFLAYGSYASLLYDFSIPFIIIVYSLLNSFKYVWRTRNNID